MTDHATDHATPTPVIDHDPITAITTTPPQAQKPDHDTDHADHTHNRSRSLPPPLGGETHRHPKTTNPGAPMNPQTARLLSRLLVVSAHLLKSPTS